MTIGRVARVLLPMTLLGAVTVAAATSDVEQGQRLYRIHCQACHGESAQGDGAMKDRLDTAPADLTTIAERNQDEFPQDAVYEIIDGRRDVPAHGTREMPVWGFTFQGSGLDTDQQKNVSDMVTALTRYLESIQVASTTGTGEDASQR